jgi:non-heme chloroperoxidase
MRSPRPRRHRSPPMPGGFRFGGLLSGGLRGAASIIPSMFRPLLFAAVALGFLPSASRAQRHGFLSAIQPAPQPGTGALPREVTDHFFLSSDGVRLHYLEAGPLDAHTLVFVPGWTMPAWIWMPQILGFSRRYHVVAFDPRGQGDSAIPAGGYEPVRRGRDVAELIAHLNGSPVVVVGWSLGVLDTLASIHVAGDRRLAGLVLVDNSVGEEPPPIYRPVPQRRGRPPTHEAAMRQFVRAMFRHVPPRAYLDRLTEAALRTPETASRLLLAYPEPRSYWREAVYATKVPLLYVIRPRWLAQGENLVRNRPETEVDVFNDAGHALFVDEPARFNSVTERFLQRFVWP